MMPSEKRDAPDVRIQSSEKRNNESADWQHLPFPSTLNPPPSILFRSTQFNAALLYRNLLYTLKRPRDILITSTFKYKLTLSRLNLTITPPDGQLSLASFNPQIKLTSLQHLPHTSAYRVRSGSADTQLVDRAHNTFQGQSKAVCLNWRVEFKPLG